MDDLDLIKPCLRRHLPARIKLTQVVPLPYITLINYDSLKILSALLDASDIDAFFNKW